MQLLNSNVAIGLLLASKAVYSLPLGTTEQSMAVGVSNSNVLKNSNASTTVSDYIGDIAPPATTIPSSLIAEVSAAVKSYNASAVPSALAGLSKLSADELSALQNYFDYQNKVINGTVSATNQVQNKGLFGSIVKGGLSIVGHLLGGGTTSGIVSGIIGGLTGGSGSSSTTTVT